MLARYGHIENIPARAEDWEVKVRGAPRLAATLAGDRERARLFRHLATLAVEAPVSGSVDELRWAGPTGEFGEWCGRLDAPELWGQANALER